MHRKISGSNLYGEVAKGANGGERLAPVECENPVTFTIISCFLYLLLFFIDY